MVVSDVCLLRRGAACCVLMKSPYVEIFFSKKPCGKLRSRLSCVQPENTTACFFVLEHAACSASAYLLHLPQLIEPVIEARPVLVRLLFNSRHVDFSSVLEGSRNVSNNKGSPEGLYNRQEANINFYKSSSISSLSLYFHSVSQCVYLTLHAPLRQYTRPHPIILYQAHYFI